MKNTLYTITLVIFVLLFSILTSPAAWVVFWEENNNGTWETAQPKVFESSAEMVAFDKTLKPLETSGGVRNIQIFQGERVAVVYDTTETNIPTPTGEFGYVVAYRVPFNESQAYQYTCTFSDEASAKSQIALVEKNRLGGNGWELAPGFEQPLRVEKMDSNRVFIVSVEFVEN